jgi:hypothetical protein
VSVPVLYERERGCGWRQPGGLYLVSGASLAPCCSLPFELTVCQCCGQGIKPARGWTWVEPGMLLRADSPPALTKGNCRGGACQVFRWQTRSASGRHGLLWVGGRFYSTPDDFQREAAAQGVSRRISAVPRDFKLGETWVLLAHRAAITRLELGKEAVVLPGVFSAFLPQRIEAVVTPGDAEDAGKMEALRRRGLTPVIVERLESRQTEMF